MKLINKKMSNNKIYSIPHGHQLTRGGEMEASEIKRDDIEDRFVKTISDLLCEKLEIGYNDQRIFKTLLTKVLKDDLNNRDDNNPGMLQQYLAHELEQVFKNLKRELIVPDEVKINHNYHIHSKFNDFIDYVKKNYIRKEDINSDGTFSTIEEKGKELSALRNSEGEMGMDMCMGAPSPSSER